MLETGQSFGHFHILRLIGSGGMGQVYEAVDSRLERVVALKLINIEYGRSEQYRSRLADEAKLAARIDSQHVVKIWEHSIHDDHPFIAMEYVAGEDFRSAVAQYGFDRKIEIACQLADGILAAHTQGLLHRDLKPDNLRLTKDGIVKILDFGLAKALMAGVVNSQGMIEGTPGYMSPEQLSAGALTISSDLFSFGVILYELFTGCQPYERDHPANSAYAVLHENPIPPSELDSGLPAWLDAIIMKLLQKTPEERFVNAAEVLHEFNLARSSDFKTTHLQYIKPRKKATVVDLKNLSGDSTWDYFCLGVTHDIIRELSRRTDLIVSAEPSAPQPRDVHEVFALCRADFVLIGSLMKSRDLVTLQLSMYGGNGQTRIFEQSYTGKSEALPQLLSSAAVDVSMALAHATGLAMLEVEDHKTVNVIAYTYYLQGMSSYQADNSAERLGTAEKLFAQALEIEPDFVLARAGLSDTYATQYMEYYDRSSNRIEMARQEAIKGIEIGPNVPEVHRSLGRYYMLTGELTQAEECFRRAIECNPKYAIGYRTIAWLKRQEGDYSQAQSWARKALDLAPTDLETLILLSLISIDQRRFTPAVAILHRAIEINPEYGWAYFNLGEVYSKLGVLDMALENLELAIKFKGDPNCYTQTGYCHLVMGDYCSARKRFEESISAGYLPFVAYYYLAYVEKILGNTEQARIHLLKVQELTRFAALEDRDLHPLGFFAMAAASLGDTHTALQILSDLEPRIVDNGELLYSVARAYAILGDNTRAQAMTGKALTARFGPTEREIALDPHFVNLRRRASGT
jgi:serine/threonine protein kinase/tetratricopeptide (TPR) repeat protein